MGVKTKRYYWLKLKEDFFEEDTIEWIEEQPGGEKYSLFYLKLCLKSLKTDGVLIRNVGDMLIPYDVKKLAEITKTDIDTVRVAMELFKKLGLVQILENGEIYLSQLKNMVGSESAWAEKKRLQRQNNAGKELPAPDENKPKDNKGTLSPPCPTEKEKEKEKDIEKEIETDKQTDKEKDPAEDLTPRQMERVDLLRDLFAGWSVSDFQIFYLSTKISDKIPYDPIDGPNGRDIKIYDYLDDLIMRAKIDNVKNIYRWLLKVIPEVD